MLLYINYFFGYNIDIQQSFETFWRIIDRLKDNPSPVAQVDAAISCLMAWQVIDQGLDQGITTSSTFMDDAYHDVINRSF